MQWPGTYELLRQYQHELYDEAERDRLANPVLPSDKLAQGFTDLTWDLWWALGRAALATGQSLNEHFGTD